MKIEDRKIGIDWEEIGREAAKILSDYIKIRTVNPPGDEEEAARFLESILKREGIEPLIMRSAPRRANLISRLSAKISGGDTSGLILLSHIDVVPVEEDKWERDPFGGEIVDGHIWGRGAVDDKGMGVMNLMATILVKRIGIELKRDLVFLATADEETGGKYGAGYMVKEQRERLKGKYLLNEGGAIVTDALPKGRPLVTVGAGEKGPLWLKLKRRGTPGHGSVPLPDNAVLRLSEALLRIERGKRPVIFSDVMVDFAAGLGDGMGGIKGGVLRLTALPPLRGLIGNIMGKNLSIGAMMRDTVSVTTFNAGVKENVIPDEAAATLDNRLLPGTDKSEYLDWIKKTMKDDSIEIEEIFHSPASRSPVDTDFYGSVKAVAQDMYPDVTVVPMVTSSFTDSRFFRDIGMVSYGLIPAELTTEELAAIHGHNERISERSLTNGVKFVYNLILKLCA
ncbi:MAG: M20/M25/M40 family metallo-hydrolase [Deltaproteobacteria bacterium]|uniref:M20/M25/M40 family metallo-hydrolase n=1 Tax=Candidatus Zymogenus saltonus TaxID=2844893 RepID=A0A9D8KF09_9DELT|nr:M20/M25/M40 family metallo-hydrolase [Candidatus Zymogenus saltonus]